MDDDAAAARIKDAARQVREVSTELARVRARIAELEKKLSQPEKNCHSTVGQSKQTESTVLSPSQGDPRIGQITVDNSRLQSMYTRLKVIMQRELTEQERTFAIQSLSGAQNTQKWKGRYERISSLESQLARYQEHRPRRVQSESVRSGLGDSLYQAQENCTLTEQEADRQQNRSQGLQARADVLSSGIAAATEQIRALVEKARQDDLLIQRLRGEIEGLPCAQPQVPTPQDTEDVHTIRATVADISRKLVEQSYKHALAETQLASLSQAIKQAGLGGSELGQPAASPGELVDAAQIVRNDLNRVRCAMHKQTAAYNSVTGQLLASLEQLLAGYTQEQLKVQYEQLRERVCSLIVEQASTRDVSRYIGALEAENPGN